jgi:hypothetical protein
MSIIGQSPCGWFRDPISGTTRPARRRRRDALVNKADETPALATGGVEAGGTPMESRHFAAPLADH